MASACQAIPYDGAFAREAIAFFDCQAQVLGSQGFLGLASPGSSVLVGLSGLLAIFVAVFGFRLLLGHGPGLREGVLSVAKVGVVLALATSWPAYQVLIYDIVLKAPAELVAEAGGPSDVPGAGGDLAARLDRADLAFERLAILGVGAPAPSAGVKLPPSPFVGFDPFALGTARALFLTSAIGAFAFLRLGAGILLALGPLFVAFLLFDAIRWLFEGWLRALIALTLGAVVATLTLGMELAFLEPWLADLIGQRQADYAAPQAAAQLLAVTLVFAVGLGALLRLAALVAFNPSLSIHIAQSLAGWRAPMPEGAGLAMQGRSMERRELSRAVMTSHALEQSVRREQDMRTAQMVASLPSLGSGVRSNVAPSAPSPQSRLGPAVSAGVDIRRTTRRVSPSARSRDQLR
jgi:type IV secretion system protein VirB6